MAAFRAADRYAKSVLGLAKEQGQLEAIHQDMLDIKGAIHSSRPLRQLLASPVIGTDAKLKALHAIFEGELQPMTMSFIDIMLRKGREGNLLQVSEAFTNQYNTMHGISRAYLSAAAPLGPDVTSALTAKLEQQTGQRLELHTTIDPSLIGGFVVRIGDRQVDASVAAQLQKIRKELITDDYIRQF